jgi:trans-2,3-dihydro-3-hydroxyanthranilate isomerase
MSSHRYRVVDVFTQRPLEGNSLAIFPDGSKFDGPTMQRIARELSLPETVFLLPPTRAEADAKLRIFTPARELEFAGHPTIGTSFLLLDEGIVSKDKRSFTLEEGIGLVPIRVEENSRPRIWLATPPIEFGPVYDRALCASRLGLSLSDLLDVPPQLVSAGNPTAFVALKNKDAVDRAWLEASGLAAMKGKDARAMCGYVFTPTPEGAYTRMFGPEYGVPEDPATGSSAGPLAAYMMRAGLASKASGTRLLIEQGTKMGRKSLLHVQIHGESGKDGIDVGGEVTPLTDAMMHL